MTTIEFKGKDFNNEEYALMVTVPDEPTAELFFAMFEHCFTTFGKLPTSYQVINTNEA